MRGWGCSLRQGSEIGLAITRSAPPPLLNYFTRESPRKREVRGLFLGPHAAAHHRAANGRMRTLGAAMQERRNRPAVSVAQHAKLQTQSRGNCATMKMCAVGNVRLSMPAGRAGTYSLFVGIFFGISQRISHVLHFLRFSSFSHHFRLFFILRNLPVFCWLPFFLEHAKNGRRERRARPAHYAGSVHTMPQQTPPSPVPTDFIVVFTTVNVRQAVTPLLPVPP